VFPISRLTRLEALVNRSAMARTDVVVGVNGSRGSTAALTWALDEASRRGAGVRAVLAWADKDRPAKVDATAVSPRLPDLAMAADKELRRLVATALSADVGAARQGSPDLHTPVDERAVYSTAAHALLQESLNAALLVIGSQAHAAPRWALRGPVAEACAHDVPIPLVVVPAQFGEVTSRRADDRPVVVGVDGSRGSALAAQWAATEAAIRRVPLRVLHIVDARSAALLRAPFRVTIPVVRPAVPIPAAPIHAAVARRTNGPLYGRLPVGVVPVFGPLDPARLVARIVAEVRATPGGPPVELVTKPHGPAAARLLDAGKDAQLLVVGARGLGGFPGLPLGSTADQCLARVTCPTAIVRDQTS
jgi:nucleotide-binding universal stress UspA family protein